MNKGNISLGGILTECNEFSINLMTKENFERYEYFEGKEILNLKHGVVGGMLNIFNNTSFNISKDPIVFDLYDVYVNMKRMNIKIILMDDGIYQTKDV